MKSSEAPESTRVFAGMPLMIMVVNIGGGFCSICSGVIGTAMVGIFGVVDAFLLPSNASLNEVPSIFGLENRFGTCDSRTWMELDSGAVDAGFASVVIAFADGSLLGLG